VLWHSITENGLLYLFTTIAQCLAALIALLAALALYRLQSISAASWNLCGLLMEVFARKGAVNDELAALNTLRTEGRFEEFIAKRDELLNPNLWGAKAGAVELPPLPLAKVQLAKLRVNMAEHKKIKAWLWAALIAAAIVMTASIVASPFAHYFSCDPCMAWSVVAGFSFCFIVCVCLFFGLIKAALSSRARAAASGA
jgi:hypothetical protein